MKAYPLRNVPADLWRAVKIRAAQEGRSIREIIIDALRQYVAQTKEDEL
jgi:plasmid stability protein